LKGIAHILDYRFTHRELPPKRRQSYYVAPSDQIEESAGFAKELKDAVKRGPTAVLEVKLAMAASRKRKAVLGLIEDHVLSKQKVIVFTARRRDCDELGELVRKMPAVKDTKATVWVGHGDLSVDARQAIVDDYMAHSGPCVFVATGQSAGESLNLQDTDALLFVMLPYTPEKLRQWEGRVARQGQKRPVTIYFVIAEGTIDEHIAQILIDKLPAVEKIAQDGELAEAADILAGYDPNKTPEEFAASILALVNETSADAELDDWD
jgi:superfamily II DNA/RNA helicase